MGMKHNKEIIRETIINKYGEQVLEVAGCGSVNDLPAVKTIGTISDNIDRPQYYRPTGKFPGLPAAQSAPVRTYQEMEQKFTDGKNSHKKCWELVAKKLNTEGYSATGPQCSSKLRSLKKTYKAIKDHNSKSGNDRRTWQYFEAMDEIFAKAAWCEPIAVASSSGVTVKRVDTDSGTESASSSSGVSGKSNTVSRLMKRRLEQKEEHEKNKKTRHEERMAMDQKLLDILQKLVEK